jgi:hypothetical protein
VRHIGRVVVAIQVAVLANIVRVAIRDLRVIPGLVLAIGEGIADGDPERHAVAAVLDLLDLLAGVGEQRHGVGPET